MSDRARERTTKASPTHRRGEHGDERPLVPELVPILDDHVRSTDQIDVVRREELVDLEERKDERSALSGDGRPLGQVEEGLNVRRSCRSSRKLHVRCPPNRERCPTGRSRAGR